MKSKYKGLFYLIIGIVASAAGMVLYNWWTGDKKPSKNRFNTADSACYSVKWFRADHYLLQESALLQVDRNDSLFYYSISRVHKYADSTQKSFVIDSLTKTPAVFLEISQVGNEQVKEVGDKVNLKLFQFEKVTN